MSFVNISAKYWEGIQEATVPSQLPNPALAGQSLPSDITGGSTPHFTPFGVLAGNYGSPGGDGGSGGGDGGGGGNNLLGLLALLALLLIPLTGIVVAAAVFVTCAVKQHMLLRGHADQVNFTTDL